MKRTVCGAHGACRPVAASSRLAHAVPPTATPSPGYDARLQEQRAASSATDPARRSSGPASRQASGRAH